MYSDNTMPSCVYCNKPGIFWQPHFKTGELVDVCKEHFVMSGVS